MAWIKTKPDPADDAEPRKNVETGPSPDRPGGPEGSRKTQGRSAAMQCSRASSEGPERKKDANEISPKQLNHPPAGFA